MPRSPRARSTLPLRLRLPNPPAVFVGRALERERLAEAVARAPVTRVAGPGGVGKTALVLDVLHRRLEAHADRALYLAVGDGEPGNELRGRLIAALADAEREAALDLVGAATDVEETVVLALELAERRPWCVVIDDAHLASDAAQIDALLGALARYARQSRWIAISRSQAAPPELRGQIVALDGMPEGELVQLGAQLRPTATPQALHRAAAAAAGSPWLLVQQVVGGEGAAAERERLLAELEPRAADLLRALATVPEGLAPATLERATPLPAASELAWLEQRGLLTAGGDVLRLHPVVRGLLVAPGPNVAAELDTWRARVRDAAGGEEGSLGDRVVALELSAELGDLATMERLLAAWGDALLEAALAPRLWRALEHAPRASLRSWRLRCAAELGNPTVLEALVPPRGGDPGERLVWARMRVARGEHEDARRALAPLLDTPARGRAALVEARAALHAGRFEHAAARARAAREIIAASEPGDDVAQDAALALAVRCDAACGGTVDEAALAHLASRPLEPEARLDLAAALIELDRPGEAEAVIECLLAPQRDAVRLFAVREATLLAARARFERGLVEEAIALADEVRPIARSPSVQRAALCVLDLELCLASGALAGMRARIEGALRSSADVDALSLARARRAAALWAVASGASASRPESGGDERTELARAEHALRWGGEAGPRSALAGAAARSRLSAELLRALELLLAGEAVGAATLANDVDLGARRAGLPWLALAAERARCDALAAQGDLAALRAGAAALAARAGGLGANGVALEAELLLRHGEPSALEAIAQREDRSPVAVRRARALLGAPAALDRVDELVLLALESHGATPRITTLPPGASAPGAWAPGWGLDCRAGAVWLEDGSEIALAKTPLLVRILEVLFEGGGRASKEALVLRAWGEAEYHPLRHDARLQVAVRKLREKLERDPSRPTRVVTTEDGYALGGTARRAGP